MDENEINPQMEEPEIPDTPEDVAVLYSWANLHGAKYRDFSASRREYRAQIRQRAMETQRTAELKAAQEREDAARQEEESTRQASGSATNHPTAIQTEESVLRVEAQRQEAQRHSHAAGMAEQAAREAEREVEEARRSAREQAARYAESDARRRAVAGSQPHDVPGEIQDPYHYSGHSVTTHTVQASGVRTAYSSRVARDSKESKIYPVAPSRAAGSSSSASRLIRDEIVQQDSRYSKPAGNDRYAQDSRNDYGSERSRDERRSGERAKESGTQDASQQLIPSPPHSSSGSVRTPATGSYRAAETDWVQPRHEDPQDSTGAAESSDPEETGRRHESVTGGSSSAGGKAPQPHETFRSTDPRPAHEEKSRDRERQDAEEHAHLFEEIERRQEIERRVLMAAQDRERQMQENRARGLYQREEERDRHELMTQEVTREEEHQRAEQEYRLAEARRKIEEEHRFSDARRKEEEELLRRERERENARARSESNQGVRASGIRSAASTIRPIASVQESRPAWLYNDQDQARPATTGSAMNDTLQYSRERVAARWYALKELIGQPSHDVEPKIQQPVQAEMRTPTLAVMSLAGGVGKTSLVATLGRTLSAMGEKVLLADTVSHGLLPYYFGARDLRPNTVRTFSPPPGSMDAPVYMVNYQADQIMGDAPAQDVLMENLHEASRGIHRVLLDLNATSTWMVRRLAKSNLTVLVPVAPDMNSVLGIQGVEKMLQDMTDAEGRPLQPYYVLNHFDASLPLHLDVREVMRQKLGDRLLPIVIRRAPAVSEALAEGMTVIDYAPGSQVMEDYTQLATWIRNRTAPATAGFRGMRWSEG